MPAGKVISGSALIVSVYPLPTTELQRDYGPSSDPKGPRRTIFKLPPWERGKPPVTLDVFDSWQIEKDPERGGHRSMRFTAEEVGRDLVTCWTTGIVGAPAGAKPGIGLWLEDGPPTKEFVDALLAQQDVFFEYQYRAGEELAYQKKFAEISHIHRAGAHWHRKFPDWAQRMDQTHTEECPLCGFNIPDGKPVCMNCKNVIRPVLLEKLQLGALEEATAPKKHKAATNPVHADVPEAVLND